MKILAIKCWGVFTLVFFGYFIMEVPSDLFILVSLRIEAGNFLHVSVIKVHTLQIKSELKV